MTLKFNRLVKIRNLFEFILLQIFSQVNEIIETFFNNWSIYGSLQQVWRIHNID